MKHSPLTPHHQERGNSLVGTMVTVVIILILVVVLFKGSSVFGKSDSAPARKDGKGTTVLGAARYSAKDEVCRSNIGQLRQSITVYQSSNEDQFPATLPDTKLGQDFYRCPLGKEPYQYDPATGTVHCVHPGHEKY